MNNAWKTFIFNQIIKCVFYKGFRVGIFVLPRHFQIMENYFRKNFKNFDFSKHSGIFYKNSSDKIELCIDGSTINVYKNVHIVRGYKFHALAIDQDIEYKDMCLDLFPSLIPYVLNSKTLCEPVKLILDTRNCY